MKIPKHVLFRYHVVILLVLTIHLVGCDHGTIAGAEDGNSSGAVSTYSISGTISGAATEQVTIALGGDADVTLLTDGSGKYSFTGLASGTYTVTPSSTGYVFSPGSRTVTLGNGDVTGNDFSSVAITYDISGSLTGVVVNGVALTLSGAVNATTISDGNGKYSLTGLPNGDYTVTPSSLAYSFSPASILITINNAGVAGADFFSTEAVPLIAEPFATSPGLFSFTRKGMQYVPDWDGVLLPLVDNEFGIVGGRRVKNMFLNSDDVSQWNIFGDGTATISRLTGVDYGDRVVTAMQIDNSSSQAGGPYLYTVVSAEPGGMPPHLFSSRFDSRQLIGTKSWVHQGRTWGAAIGSESNSYNYVPTSSWATTTQTLQLFEPHIGDALRISGLTTGASRLQVAHVQFEDVSGFRAGMEFSSEYVASSVSPGIKWFTTVKGTQRTNPSPTYGQDNGVVSYGGELADAEGAALTGIRGILIEPVSTNLIQSWNNADNIGIAVLDGPSSAAVGGPVVPMASGTNAAYLDPRSGRYCYNKTDIALRSGVDSQGNDTITSISTDFLSLGFRPGMAIWVWRANTPAANGDIQGPFTIQSVTARIITLVSSGAVVARDAGNVTHIARIPKAGDDIIIQMNNGAWHKTTVGGNAILPPYNPTYGAHDSVRVLLDNVAPSDGGYAGNNNNRPVYYWDNATDVGVSVRSGPGATPTLVNDRVNLIAAGLGFLNRAGNVVMLDNSTGGADTYYVVDGANTDSSGAHTSSAWLRIDTGTGALGLEQHPEAVPFSNTGWARVVNTQTPMGTGYRLEVRVPAGSRVWLTIPQLEHSPAATSEILTRGASATRSAVVISAAWSSNKKNNIKGQLRWTPLVGPISTKQVLWSLYMDSANYLELSVSGATVTMRKCVSGVNYDATRQLAPVAGQTYLVDFMVSSVNGVNIAVDSVAGIPNDNTLDVALTALASHEIGSINGMNQMQGAISDFRMW